MINKVEQFLLKYHLNSPKNTLLVGFSGGADSLSLLYILHKISKKYKYNLVACHLNHNFRGEEADIEAQNCQQFCASNKIEYFEKKLAISKNKSEDFARKKRYEFFKTCGKKFKTNIVLTAHNFDDNAETLIYRIAKGTGIKGLEGISEFIKKDELEIYRPFLTIERKKIEDFCKKYKLKPNQDSSNNDIKYKRNLIRKKILPILTQINLKVKNAVNNLSIRATEEEKIIKEYLSILKKELIKDEKFNTSKFFMQSKEVQKRLIYDFLTENKFEYDNKKIEDILSFLSKNKTSKTGKKYSLNNNYQIFINKENFYKICEKTNEKIDLDIDLTQKLKYETEAFVLEIKPINKIPKNFPKDSENKIYADLQSKKFTFRQRNNGDIIHPLGMQGKMKFKKYLIDKGIPQHERENILCLAEGNEIFWAVGIGISEKIKVGNKVSYMIKFTKRS